jgi:hypothetical protein
VPARVVGVLALLVAVDEALAVLALVPLGVDREDLRELLRGRVLVRVVVGQLPEVGSLPPATPRRSSPRRSDHHFPSNPPPPRPLTARAPNSY